MSYVYQRSEANLFTVGFYTPSGEWRTESDHSDRQEAARRVAWLNGSGSPELLALGRQYASECGDCAGTRVCPDDEPCESCEDIWAVIDRAEGRA